MSGKWNEVGKRREREEAEMVKRGLREMREGRKWKEKGRVNKEEREG